VEQFIAGSARSRDLAGCPELSRVDDLLGGRDFRTAEMLHGGFGGFRTAWKGRFVLVGDTGERVGHRGPPTVFRQAVGKSAVPRAAIW
jgi:hypothetical protein